MPTESDLHSRYRSLDEPCYLSEAEVRVIQFRKELLAIRDCLKATPSSLLDVGCSYGLMLKAACDLGISVVGLELSADQVAHCRAQGFDVRAGGISKLNPAERFEVIIMWDVLEHLIDPAGELAALRNHVHEGAVISLVVPDLNSHIARFLGERWWSILDLHLHYPTELGMKLLLERTGFTSIHIGTHPKLVTARQLARWIPVAAIRRFAQRIVSPRMMFTLDPRDQMLIRAVARASAG